MTELIVALDLPASEARGLFNQLERETEVKWFKVGIRTILDFGGPSLCERIAERWNLMMDLKCYDTRDTVAATARRVFDLGARFLTVHATPSMLEAAMAAKTDERQKVLAVGPTSDQTYEKYNRWIESAEIELCDGVVCPAAYAYRWVTYLHRNSRFAVCPGVRPLTIKQDRTGSKYIDARSDDHTTIVTPRQARAAGADYVVVGRPIYQAEDPVAATIAIMEELKG